MPRLHMPFTAGQAVAYATLPRIIPRLREIGFNFKFVAYMMAVLYGMAGLLPRNHAFLNPSNIGTYSVRQVFIEAAFNLKFRWAHIDQVIIFFLLLAAFSLLAIQFVMMAIYVVIGFAHAGVGFTSMFSTPNPSNDIALILLDRVFGVPNFFGTCISDTTLTCDPTGRQVIPPEPAAFPTREQIALQSLFAFYSMGMLLVAGALIVYYLFAVVMESVQTGVPFGERFDTVYAPIRLCLAVLALIPVPLGTPGPGYGNLGYNAAQYLTLYVARAGSSFGTNTWNTFNNYYVMGGTGAPVPAAGYGPLNPAAVTGTNTPAHSLVARPKSGDVTPIVQFMHLVHTCRALYARAHNQTINGYVISPFGFMPLNDAATTYANVMNLTENGTITVGFGYEEGSNLTPPNPSGDISPVCGQVAIRINDRTQPGSNWMYEQHFIMLRTMWNDATIRAFGDRIAAITYPGFEPRTVDPGCNIPVPTPAVWGTCSQFPAPAWFIATRDLYQGTLDANVVNARDLQIGATTSQIDPRILSRGWAGAGIWYNRLATVNGSLFDASRSLPEVKSMPLAMKMANQERTSGVEITSAKDRYTPAIGPNRDVRTPLKQMADALNQVYVYFYTDIFIARINKSSTGNPLFDMMNALFGTEALFELRTNTDVNPLVQLVGLGKSITDSAIYNLMGATALQFIGGIVKQTDNRTGIGASILSFSSALFTVTTLALGIGIMLYYIIPFLPFIYFFFSVIKWLQSIFEAMVGMPLWAIAHLKINGTGVPGEAAANGYYLLLEILIRPALTIFGMIASFGIFTAMVFTMNDLFGLLTENLGGYSPTAGSSNLGMTRGTIDQFFYTILYAVLVYIIAMSCFKLIDQIPAQILRWMGSGVRNIIDETGDSTEGLVRSVYLGAFGMPVVQKSGALGQAIGGIRNAAEGMGEVVGTGINAAANAGTAPVIPRPRSGS
jgi:hypothetical protein